jgi:hypothetical protein
MCKQNGATYGVAMPVSIAQFVSLMGMNPSEFGGLEVKDRFIPIGSKMLCCIQSS